LFQENVILDATGQAAGLQPKAQPKHQGKPACGSLFHGQAQAHKPFRLVRAPGYIVAPPLALRRLPGTGGPVNDEAFITGSQKKGAFVAPPQQPKGSFS